MDTCIPLVDLCQFPTLPAAVAYLDPTSLLDYGFMPPLGSACLYYFPLLDTVSLSLQFCTTWRTCYLLCLLLPGAAEHAPSRPVWLARAP